MATKDIDIEGFLRGSILAPRLAQAEDLPCSARGVASVPEGPTIYCRKLDAKEDKDGALDTP